jgi:transposase-like protein
MTKKRRQFPEGLKRSAVRRVVAGEAVATVARAIGVDRRRLDDWCLKYQEGGEENLRRVGRPSKSAVLARRAGSAGEALDELTAARRQIADLERKVGQQQVDLDFFRRALRLAGETRRAHPAPGAAGSTKSSRR